MKDKLGGKIVKEFPALRPETHSHLKKIKMEIKKSKGTQKSDIRKT